VSLVAGAGLGYSISLPQIMTLQSSVSELELETSASTNDYNNLNTTYNQLRDSYDSLNATYYELTSELSTLIADYSYLNESYVELSQQYEDLLFHYNLINGPASNFTTIKDLQITFTTDRTTYYYKDPLSGNVTMAYLNGTLFEGSFDLFVTLIGGGRSGARFNIRNGFADFTYGPPAFIYGPGTYSVKIGWIFTIDDFVVADPNDAGLPEVLVEAK